MALRARTVGLALATMTICPAAMACARNPSGQAGQRESSAVACTTTRYVLTVHPTTIVSNQRDRLLVRAQADSCGHFAAVRGAGIRLLGYRATTGKRGRCTLDVDLPTGRYVVRLYVHGHRVARARVSAIPLVAN